MAQAQHLETGQVFFEYIAGGQSPTIVEANWRTITFNQPFEGRPVVIAGPLSQPNFNEQADSESLSIRIRNVTTTGFKIAVQHPNGQSGSGLDLNAYWVAVPQGIFTLGDGSKIEGVLTSTDEVRWRENQINIDTVSAEHVFTEDQLFCTP